MKKNFLIFMLLFLFTSGIQAQESGEWYWRGSAGLGLSTITGGEAKWKIGSTLGFDVGVKLSDAFGVTLGLHNTLQGYKEDGGSETVQMDYFNIPLMANVYVAPKLSLMAGVQPNILLSAWFGGSWTGGDECTDNFRKFDLTLPVGVAYEFDLNDDGESFFVELRYNIGLSKVPDSSATGYVYEAGSSMPGNLYGIPSDARSSSIMLSFGYKGLW